MMKVKKIMPAVIAVAALAYPALAAPIPYVKGVWSSFAVLDQGGKVPQGLIDNKGLVGLTAEGDWDEIQTGPDTFDWTALDNKIAAIKNAGFKYINLNITASSDKTPQWLLDSLPPEEIIYLRDGGQLHTSYCDEIETALYWSSTFHAARLNLIRKAGERYANDPAIITVNTQFANHHSNDWNILDIVGTIGPCSDGKTYEVNQPLQWTNAGWTIDKMYNVGKEILDTTAASFPNQWIKLPIGGLDDALVVPFLGPDSGYGSFAKMIVDYAATTSYANRFYPQRNTLAANWGLASTFPDSLSEKSLRYPQYLVWNHTRPDGTTPGQGGLQNVQAATDGAITSCRQGGGPNGPCGPDCDPVCVLQTSLNVAISFNPSFIEVWEHDAENPNLYSMIQDATLAIGGTSRDAPAPPRNLRVVP